MNSDYSFKWFVAQVKPNAHFKAKKNIERQGFETFLPLVESTRRKSKKFANHLIPLFPGYIFVSFEADNFKWYSINNTFGVKKLIAFENKPKRISSGFVHSLKSRCDEEGKLMEMSNIKIGNKIRVLHGPFTEIIGEIENIKPENRITILLDMLGQKTRATVKHSSILSV